MKYTSLEQQGEEEGNDALELEPTTSSPNAPACNDGWVLLLSMMGFFMLVAAFSLHNNEVTQQLRGPSYMDQNNYTEPCNVLQGMIDNCHEEELSVDDLVATEVWHVEPVTYGEMEEEFSERLDEDDALGNEEGDGEGDDEPVWDGEEDLNVPAADDLIAEELSSEEQEVLFNQSTDSTDPSQDVKVQEAAKEISDQDDESEDHSTVERMEDEDHIGN